MPEYKFPLVAGGVFGCIRGLFLNGDKTVKRQTSHGTEKVSEDYTYV